MLRALVVCSVDADAKIPDLFRMLAEHGFQTTHCTSTDDAVRRYFAKTQHQLPAPDKDNERCFFDVVITKLGRESQGSAMNGNQLLQAVQACHGKRAFLVVWSFSATADAAIRWHLSVNGANMVTHDLGALRRVLVKVAWIKLTGTLVADPSVEASSLSTLPTLGDVLREVGSGAAAGKSAEKEDQRQVASSDKTSSNSFRPEGERSTVLEAFWKSCGTAGKSVEGDSRVQAMDVDSSPRSGRVPGPPGSRTGDNRCVERRDFVSRSLAKPYRRPELFSCPFCGMENLTEDALWLHSPLYHINFRPQPVRRDQLEQTPGGEDRDLGADISRSSPSSSPGVEHQRSVGITATGGTPMMRPLKMTCPVCLSKGQRVHREENLQYHIRNAHGPCDPARAGEHQLRFLSEYATSQRPPSLHAFALVVCIDAGSDPCEVGGPRQGGGKDQEQRGAAAWPTSSSSCTPASASTSTPTTPPTTSGKLLLVQEFASSGYWLPGGRVDAGESLESAAIRECEEEAGVAIELLGVLQVQYRNSPSPSVGVLPGGGGSTATPGRCGGNYGNTFARVDRETSTHHGSAAAGTTSAEAASASSTSQPRYRSSVRLRVIFFARPKAGGSRVPKTIPDYESAGACWIRLDDPNLEKLPYRGSEPIFWANYIRNGGAVYPMALISGREN